MVELIARYKAVSSAKSLTLDMTCSGRSFMYARKKIGPRTEQIQIRILQDITMSGSCNTGRRVSYVMT